MKAKVIARPIRKKANEKDWFTTGTVFFRKNEKGLLGSIVVNKVDPFDKAEKISIGVFTLTPEDLKKLEEA